MFSPSCLYIFYIMCCTVLVIVVEVQLLHSVLFLVVVPLFYQLQLCAYRSAFPCLISSLSLPVKFRVFPPTACIPSNVQQMLSQLCTRDCLGRCICPAIYIAICHISSYKYILPAPSSCQQVMEGKYMNKYEVFIVSTFLLKCLLKISSWSGKLSSNYMTRKYSTCNYAPRHIAGDAHAQCASYC